MLLRSENLYKCSLRCGHEIFWRTTLGSRQNTGCVFGIVPNQCSSLQIMIFLHWKISLMECIPPRFPDSVGKSSGVLFWTKFSKKSPWFMGGSTTAWNYTANLDLQEYMFKDALTDQFKQLRTPVCMLYEGVYRFKTYETRRAVARNFPRLLRLERRCVSFSHCFGTLGFRGLSIDSSIPLLVEN